MIFFLIMSTLFTPHVGSLSVFDRTNSRVLNEWDCLGPANASQTIELVFRVKEKNMGFIAKFVEDSANPISPRYQHHLSKKELDDLTANPEGSETVESYLLSVKAKIQSKSSNSLIFSAVAKVLDWEMAFSCVFSEFTFKAGGIPGKFVRTTEFSLPPTVAANLHMVENTCDFPVLMHHGPIRHRGK